MFRGRLPSICSTSSKCNACQGICTLSPLDAALTMRFAKITPQDTSKVLRLPRKMTMDTSKVLRLPQKLQRISGNVAKVLRLPQKTTFDALRTHLNVTKRHACHAKRSNATFETSKNDPFCRTYHRHGHTGLARTAANGCERLRTVEDGCGRGNVEGTHPPSRLVSSTMVTAHSVPRTCPSSSAAKEIAVLRVQCQ